MQSCTLTLTDSPLTHFQRPNKTCRELLTIGGRLAALEDRMAAVEKAIKVPGVDPRCVLKK